jgi:hypothetical protein
MRDRPDISPLLPDEEALRARRRALVETLAAAPRRRRSAGARRALAVALATLAVGAGVAWAAGAFSAGDVSPDAGVACYETASLQASAAIFQSAADPVAKCARLWRRDELGLRLRRLEREGKIPERADKTPPLVACTGKGRGVLVMPGPAGTCQRLGLVPLPHDYEPIAVSHARAYRAWFEIEKATDWESLARLGDVVCASPQAAAARARVALSHLDPVHAVVPVRIHGGLPCAKELDAQGGGLNVVTITRTTAREEARGRAASEALRGLGDRTRERCVAPAEFLREARVRLERAGVTGVEVRMHGRGRCVSGAGSGMDGHYRWLEFFAVSKDVWAAEMPAAGRAG